MLILWNVTTKASLNYFFLNKPFWLLGCYYYKTIFCPHVSKTFVHNFYFKGKSSQQKAHTHYSHTGNPAQMYIQVIYSKPSTARGICMSECNISLDTCLHRKTWFSCLGSHCAGAVYCVLYVLARLSEKVRWWGMISSVDGWSKCSMRSYFASREIIKGRVKGRVSRDIYGVLISLLFCKCLRKMYLIY